MARCQTHLFAVLICLPTIISLKGPTSARPGDEAVAAALSGKWSDVSQLLVEVREADRQLTDHILLGYASISQARWLDAWKSLSQAKITTEQDQEALRTWADRLSEPSKTSQWAAILRADCLARLGSYDDSLRQLDALVKSQTCPSLAHDLRALVLIHKGDLAQAKLALDGAFDKGLLGPNGCFQRGLLYLIQGDTNRAIDILTKVIDDDPRFFLARNARGVAYVLEARYCPAFRDFENASKQARDFTPAYTNSTFAALLRAKGLMTVDLARLSKLSAKGILGTRGELYLAVGAGTAGTDKITNCTMAVGLERGQTLVGTNSYDDAIERLNRGENVVLCLDSEASEAPGILQAVHGLDDAQTHIFTLGSSATKWVGNQFKGLDDSGSIASISCFEPQRLTGVEAAVHMLPPFLAPSVTQKDVTDALGNVPIGVPINANVIQGTSGSVLNIGGNYRDVAIWKDFTTDRNGRGGTTILNTTKNEWTFSPSIAYPWGVSVQPTDSQSDIMKGTTSLITSFDGMGDTYLRSNFFDTTAASLADPEANIGEAKGVYVRLGPADMDVSSGSQQDLSFLRSKPDKSDPKNETAEPDLSYPFLLFNNAIQ